MAKHNRFTFLCDQMERRAITELAAGLHRSQSDAVRFVVIEAVKQLSQTDIARMSARPTKEIEQEEKNVT